MSTPNHIAKEIRAFVRKEAGYTGGGIAPSIRLVRSVQKHEVAPGVEREFDVGSPPVMFRYKGNGGKNTVFVGLDWLAGHMNLVVSRSVED